MEKWKAALKRMKPYERAAYLTGLVSSVGVIVTAALFLLNIWQNTLYMPLLGLTMVTQGVLQWKKSRPMAIGFLCIAGFLLVAILMPYLQK